MSTRVLLSLITVATAGTLAAQNATFPEEQHELFLLLRKTPTEGVVLNGDHVDVVNARYEPCKRKKEARYLRVINRTADGLFLERIATPDGRVLMQGTFADEHATVPQGNFTYYDEAGSLRAEGAYANGRKVGVWHRYDANGEALTDKEYDGLDWDGKQVKLGLASMSSSVSELAAE